MTDQPVRMSKEEACRVAAKAAEVAAAKALEEIIVVDAETGFEVIPLVGGKRRAMEVRIAPDTARDTAEVARGSADPAPPLSPTRKELNAEIDRLRKELNSRPKAAAPKPPPPTRPPIPFATGVTFPEGISSMAMWGRSVVTWGKAVRGRTFVEIADSEAPDDVSYVQWVGKGRKGHPGLTDFSEYLKAFKREQVQTGDAQLVFPGSSHVREMVPAAETD